MIKIERNCTPSPTNTNTNYQQFDYNIKISNPIGWSLNPKSEAAKLAVATGTNLTGSLSNKTIIKPIKLTNPLSKICTQTSAGGKKTLYIRQSLQQEQHQFMKNIDLKFCAVKREERPSGGVTGTVIGSVVHTSVKKSNDNMMYMASDDKPWVCKMCNRNYKWKNSLKCHLKNECGLPPKYFCARNCGYKTNIHSNLKRHLNSKFCKPPESESGNIDSS